MRTSWLPILGSILLTACGGSTSPEPTPVSAPTEAPAPEPQCAVAGTVLLADGTIAADFAVAGRGAVEKSERMWEAVSSAEGRTDGQGRFELPFGCGEKVSLRFGGWLWGNEPPEVWAEPGGGDLDVSLFPERDVHLVLHDADGNPVAGEFVPAGRDVPVPVPVDGVDLPGIPNGDVAGVVRVAGLGERAWRLHRSDELREVEPRHFEAAVRLDAGAPLWVYPPADKDVAGVWCVGDGVRGRPCKLREGGWYCECDGVDRVAVATTLWDVALVRDVTAKDLAIEAWPEAVSECLQVPGGGVARAHPVGLPDTLLLGGSGPANRFCLKLPRGETVRVVGTSASWDHVGEAGGDVTLKEEAALSP